MIEKSITETAQAFARLRASAKCCNAYPGILPTSLAEAYRVQKAGIDVWGRPVAGWKIGRIVGELEERLGEDRFVGPIFPDTIVHASAEHVEFPIVPNGFAALEAELIAVIRGPVIPPRGLWTAENCARSIARWHIGIEYAGSPLSAINDLGPLASIAGFGNNNGLVIGPELRGTDPEQVSCKVAIGDFVFGPASSKNLPGGPLAAVAFALNKLTQLRQGIFDGMLLSTGAITGVHEVGIGVRCKAEFNPGGSVLCETVAQKPDNSWHMLK
ncbi:hypothetical protein GRI75_10360 [Altererythrobacter soli]|uniref:2-keto-4-pentenoate hydratase n=1 Tax=Croceibacterium soli TaxID=1739690 RepID=A0A6I4UT07_9SPHN|nr:hypothetical protein [Croceibacterium soli]MXP42042.1 hypothetical protein [Croceibacterium soli]